MFTANYNISNGICWYDNAVPKDLCSELVQFFEDNTDKHFTGKTALGLSGVKVSTDLIIYPKHLSFEEGIGTDLDDRVSSYVQETINDYVMYFDWLSSAGDIRDSGYQMQKYTANHGRYGEHIDGDPWTEYINTRICGLILYLNDVYEGGGTYFRYQDVYIKAVAGRVAIFPATWSHPHEGTVPVSNDKYIISSFLHPVNVKQAPRKK